MGKRLDALLGRTFKTSKFKALVNLAISRLAILKNQRQVRCTHARSDVIQLLNLGHQDRALLRIEVVIKEQNMLDVFVMIESYCHLLLERLALIEHNKVCPDELKEAISSLIFAASRCGEFPELQEMREAFTSRYGKDFAAGAVELRNNCGVNRKLMLKFSTRQPSLESRMKVLKEIASENGIALNVEEETPVINKDNLDDFSQRQNQPERNPSSTKLEDQRVDRETHNATQEIDQNEQFSGSLRARKYRDVASAAQAAFESAAYAAEAARAAVELSRSESQEKGFDGDQSSPVGHCRNRSNGDESPRSRFGRIYAENTASAEAGSDYYSSEPENEGVPQYNPHIQAEQEPKGRTSKIQFQRSISASSSDSDGDTLNVTNTPSNVLNQRRPLQEIAFDESDDETRKEQSGTPRLMQTGLGTEAKTSFSAGEFAKTKETDTFTTSEEKIRVQHLNLERKPISMRTRRGNGR